MEQGTSLNTTSMQIMSFLEGGSIPLPSESQLDNVDTLKRSNVELDQQSTPGSLPFAVDSPFKYDSARFSQEGIASPHCVTQELPIIRKTIPIKSQHLGHLYGKAILMIPGGMYLGGRITFFNKRIVRRLRKRKTLFLSL
ncbi:hypothetical protein WA171_007196 [Blastocystis sp. BT1]